jgi:hypothetical protein
MDPFPMKDHRDHRTVTPAQMIAGQHHRLLYVPTGRAPRLVIHLRTVKKVCQNDQNCPYRMDPTGIQKVHDFLFHFHLKRLGVFVYRARCTVTFYINTDILSIDKKRSVTKFQSQSAKYPNFRHFQDFAYF